MMNEIEIISQDKLKHYIKGNYSGSYKGMRYYINSKVLEETEERVLVLCIWPEPYCIEKTPEEDKTYLQFPFTDEGLAMLEDELNEVYRRHYL